MSTLNLHPQKIDSINTRKLTKYASWCDMKMGTAKEEVRVRGLRNTIKDYQRLKEELGKARCRVSRSQFSRGMGFMSYIIETIIDEDYILLWFKRLLWMV